MNEPDAVFLPLRKLATRVRERQLSPVALTRLFLDRLERLGPRYNAVVTLTAEMAEAQAQQAEREIAAGSYRGPLHGIPYGIKDLFATSRYPTTWGAAPLRDQTFTYDAAVVRKLQAAGAVLAAKLALVAESASVMEEIIESGIAAELTAPEGRWGVYPRTAMLATDYLRALRLRRTIAVAVDRLLERYDALLAPAQPEAAPAADRPWTRAPKGERDGDPLGAFGSCLGLPAISVPMGFTAAGLPAGLQILGRAYDENVVLAVAAAYQDLTDWHAHHPPDAGSDAQPRTDCDAGGVARAPAPRRTDSPACADP